MALGEDMPRTLGMKLQQERAVSIAIAVALAAAAVSTVGTISFVGLIARHAARFLVGSSPSPNSTYSSAFRGDFGNTLHIPLDVLL